MYTVSLHILCSLISPSFPSSCLTISSLSLSLSWVKVRKIWSTMRVPPPQSCDTFVYVQAPSLDGAGTGTGTLFGKNSDRPSEERHEVVRIPRLRHKEHEVVQCTYIGVPQAPETLECILSRPSWIWGCEMGANEAGVVGGNEAIDTQLSGELLSPQDGTPLKCLLGMDLLRLALERGTSAKHAVDVCIHFLEAYGQGGPCCDDEGTDWTYENSFLFADANEAYVLETAGQRHWAWKRIGPGCICNISNGASIRSNWGAVSKDIKSICRARGWWDGSSRFGK
jgi:secernin